MEREICKYKECEREVWDRSKKEFCLYHEDVKTDEKLNLFSEKVDEMIKKGKSDFKGFVFPKNFKFSSSQFENNMVEIIFDEATFLGDIEFKDFEFYHPISFKKVTFKGKVNFEGAEFHDSSNFSKATFERFANFSKVNFHKDLNMFKVDFLENVVFERSKFGLEKIKSHIAKYLINFEKVDFKGETNFRSCKFFGKVIFSGSTFRDRVFFDIASGTHISNDHAKTKFKDRAEFYDAEFLDMVDFTFVVFEKKVSFEEGKFRDLSYFVNTEFELADFTWTYFKNVIFNASNLHKAIFKESIIEKSSIGNAKLPTILFSDKNHKKLQDPKQYIFKDEDYDIIKDEYCIIKTALQNEGYQTKAGNYYYRERMFKRKSIFENTCIMRGIRDFFLRPIINWIKNKKESQDKLLEKINLFKLFIV